MECFNIQNLSFTYSGKNQKTLDNINLKISQGEFITILGKSGSGKTTLLRLLKPSLSPYGEKQGEIYFEKRKIDDVDLREQTKKIGFVMQNPDNQIVTDKVYHELSFGLESLGLKTEEIRAKVAEMASYFGIHNWFYKNVSELSGGQKQLLNLASSMVLNPSVLILDEPTSQLDPVSAAEFLKTLKKLNDELGTTVILCEHRLEDAIPMSDRVIVLDNGKVILDSTPKEVGGILKALKHDMFFALPTPIKVFECVSSSGSAPVTVKEGRDWLLEYAKENPLDSLKIPFPKENNKETLIEFKDVYFKYQKDEPDVIKGLNAKISKGELYTIVGGNGAGKTTFLSLLSGILKPYRGEILINKKPLLKHSNLYGGILCALPQNPQTLFVKSTVYEDLFEVSKDENKIKDMARLCKIEHLLNSHPYDLSGGEQQRAALTKILLLSPEIVLLDEPTKGLDAHFKFILADIIKDLLNSGVTVIMVSHDIEFCAAYADRTALMFDGQFITVSNPREFFSGKSFYTTAANKMARQTLKNAVLPDDIILACGKEPEKPDIKNNKTDFPVTEKKTKQEEQKTSKANKAFGIIFLALFLFTALLMSYDFEFLHISGAFYTFLQVISILEIFMAIYCFIPQREINIKVIPNKRQSTKTVIATVLMLLAVLVTIYFGIFFFKNTKYYLVSILIILEIMIPFFTAFENKKPQARELVIISVMCTIAVAGRGAFFMLPQFKPVAAIVIISSLCFGGQTGFLVGAISTFVSNFFFGQGPWTPWQMFAFGMIGFLSGTIFKPLFLRKGKLSLVISGFLMTFIVYGGIMNPSHIFEAQLKPTFKLLAATYISGLPFDLLHSFSTAFFLYFIAEPMINKLERIKIKYGLIKNHSD